MQACSEMLYQLMLHLIECQRPTLEMLFEAPSAFGALLRWCLLQLSAPAISLLRIHPPMLVVPLPQLPIQLNIFP
jgi:hypothetical protein